MKYLNFKRFKFSTITKNFNTLRNNFFKFFKLLDLGRYNFKKLEKYLNFTSLFKYFNFKNYKLNVITKALDLKKYRIFPLYLIASIIFFGFIYVTIPMFYSYEKSKISKVICDTKEIECLIAGKIYYSFFPSPRIRIKNLKINNIDKKKQELITVQNAAIKLSIKNLLAKKKQLFTKILFEDYKINVNSKNLGKYKNLFNKKNNSIPITFTNGQIAFLDKDTNDYIAVIYEAKLNLKYKKKSKKVLLKGKFLNDDIYIKLENKKSTVKPSTNIILKMSNFNLITKTNLFNFNNKINGDILIKKDKHRFTGIFDYENNEVTINKSNIRNMFWDGKLKGKIKFLPYFKFDLDLGLNSINFTKLNNYFLTLDEKNQKNLFKISKKINGKLGLSADRVYSSYNLVKSFESRINFNNGNIQVDQFLINLGKLGAADILGSIKNDKKFTNFKYESNVFIDNQKKFLSKFGIYNKETIPSNLFISGNFDLQNIRNTFYEISHGDKLNIEDINFIEQEFNDYMLINGYGNLFRFPKFKEFIKSITSVEN